jgi:hypothetical protein
MRRTSRLVALLLVSSTLAACTLGPRATYAVDDGVNCKNTPWPLPSYMFCKSHRLEVPPLPRVLPAPAPLSHDGYIALLRRGRNAEYLCWLLGPEDCPTPRPRAQPAPCRRQHCHARGVGV